MSDYRFKISGNASPFLTELYNAATCSKVASQVIEHTGITTCIPNYTCGIFSGLLENTSYYAIITDNVGNTATGATCTTPSNPAPPPPTQLDINLLGTFTTVNPTPDIVTCTITSPKYIEISPSLQSDQSVTIPLTATTCSSADEAAVVDIFKRNSPSSSYNRVALIDGDETVTQSITIGEGESVCYTLYTSINTIIAGNKYVCAQLQFDPDSINNYTVNSTTNCLDISETCNITTTTTTTTEPTITVYMDSFSLLENTETAQCRSASLATEPALSAGQSFTLNYEIINKYDVNDALPTVTFMEGVVREGATTQDIVATTRRLTGENTVSQNGSIDIDSNNDGLIDFVSCVQSSLQNNSYDYSICSCIRFLYVNNQQGANFEIGDGTTYKTSVDTKLVYAGSNTTNIDEPSGVEPAGDDTLDGGDTTFNGGGSGGGSEPEEGGGTGEFDAPAMQ